jgi:hypothetical protein
MTKAGYNHVLIPISLHCVLRDKAKGQNISIIRYIQSIIERTESLPGKLVGRKPPGSSNPPSAHQSPMKAFIEIYEQPRFPSRIPLYQNKKVRFK